MLQRLRAIEVAVALCGLALIGVAAVNLGMGRDEAPAATSSDAPAMAQSGAVAVAIADFAFDARDLTVTAGSTVTWTNQDSAPHSVVSRGVDDLSSESLATGDAYEHTFDQPGAFDYICGIHNSMKGTVTVVAP